jgi:post-segregation antitoxin (ccd killing protein)
MAEPSTMISVRIPSQLHERCKKEGIHMSRVIRLALSLAAENKAWRKE